MIAVDSSSYIAFLGATDTKTDIAAIHAAAQNKTILFPPMVITELLSDHTMAKSLAVKISHLPTLDLLDGFWQRAGLLRARLREQKRKTRLADACIAQFCIDYKIPLITRDADFRHYVPFGLTLAA